MNELNFSLIEYNPLPPPPVMKPHELKVKILKKFKAKAKIRPKRQFSRGPWDFDAEGTTGIYERLGYGCYLEVGTRAGSRKCMDDNRWRHNAILAEASPVLFEELAGLVAKLENGEEITMQDLEDANDALILASRKLDPKEV